MPKKSDCLYIATDVLIIGSGGAGLRTAIELNELGVDCLVIGKCKFGDAHTTLATGGINAALGNMDPQDHWMLHAADTLKEGQFLADYRVIEKLCKEAPRAITDLVNYGMRFQRDSDGKIVQRFFGAALYRRACFSGDETGKEILRCMVAETKKRKIQFMDNVYITKLFKQHGRVVGAFGIDHYSGRFILFQAKAIVLAAGGYSRVYKRSSSRVFENTGDGITLGYEAGAALQDMEMTQFHPTGMIYPPQALGILVTEAVRGEGGILLNAKGERFMKRYDPKRMELGPRDEVARAIYREIHEGRGTKHGGVWLDITHRPKAYILQRLPKVYKQFKEFLDIDISKERMEVAPTSHYSMGGLKVRFTDMQTTVPGLYALGEVSSGVHGANRLGGNSLLECIVFGKHAGRALERFVKKETSLAPDKKDIVAEVRRITSLFGKKLPGTIVAVRAALQENMWQYAGIMRTEKELRQGLKNLEKIRQRVSKLKVTGTLKHNEQFIMLLDLENMLIPCEAILRSALLRKESRGAHARKDYPKKSDKYVGNFICTAAHQTMELTFEQLPKPEGKIVEALKTVAKARYHHLE